MPRLAAGVPGVEVTVDQRVGQAARREVGPAAVEPGQEVAELAPVVIAPAVGNEQSN